MEAILVRPKNLFFEKLFGGIHAILYTQSLALEKIKFFAEKTKNGYFVKTKEILKKISKTKDFLENDIILLKVIDVPETLFFEEDCFEEVEDIID